MQKKIDSTSRHPVIGPLLLQHPALHAAMGHTMRVWMPAGDPASAIVVPALIRLDVLLEEPLDLLARGHHLVSLQFVRFRNIKSLHVDAFCMCDMCDMWDGLSFRWHGSPRAISHVHESLSQTKPSAQQPCCCIESFFPHLGSG